MHMHVNTHCFASFTHHCVTLQYKCTYALMHTRERTYGYCIIRNIVFRTPVYTGGYVTFTAHLEARQRALQSPINDFVVAYIGFDIDYPASSVYLSPHPSGTPKASPDRATPSYRRFGNWVNSPLFVPAKLDVCRPIASPVRRCAVVQTPDAFWGQPGAAGRNRIAQARAASCCMSRACTPAPVNGRLPGVNAALVFMLPNMACCCNYLGCSSCCSSDANLQE